MNGFMAFVNEYKIIDVLILSLGALGICVLAERFKSLFLDLPVGKNFYSEIIALIHKRENDKAVVQCASQGKRPIAMVFKRLIENAHLNPEELEKVLQVSVSEVMLPITRRLGYLSMIANVVTMVGLLGTVIGLIMSFQAVSMADASQKQTLLAQGISVAMHATALGLLVAIPIMILYSFLAEKQNQILAEVDHQGQEILELLRALDRADWNMEAVFPAQSNERKRPAAPQRVS